MLGYYRAADLTAKAIDRDGWFNSGDLARFDGQYLFIVGRTKEMIIRSGFNVYPAEVEAVLERNRWNQLGIHRCPIAQQRADSCVHFTRSQTAGRLIFRQKCKLAWVLLGPRNSRSKKPAS